MKDELEFYNRLAIVTFFTRVFIPTNLYIGLTTLIGYFTMGVFEGSNIFLAIMGALTLLVNWCMITLFWR